MKVFRITTKVKATKSIQCIKFLAQFKRTKQNLLMNHSLENNVVKQMK
jgi:hypothetical protein